MCCLFVLVVVVVIVANGLLSLASYDINAKAGLMTRCSILTRERGMPLKMHQLKQINELMRGRARAQVKLRDSLQIYVD